MLFAARTCLLCLERVDVTEIKMRIAIGSDNQCLYNNKEIMKRGYKWNAQMK